jgi:hypothetical protein
MPRYQPLIETTTLQRTPSPEGAGRADSHFTTARRAQRVEKWFKTGFETGSVKRGNYHVYSPRVVEACHKTTPGFTATPIKAKPRQTVAALYWLDMAGAVELTRHRPLVLRGNIIELSLIRADFLPERLR